MEDAIGKAKSKCDQFTKSDVLHLQGMSTHELANVDEYKSLQSLHLWRPISITPSLFSLSYDAEISLHLDCINSLPDISTARVERLPMDRGAKVGRSVGGIWRGYGDSPSIGLFALIQMAVKELKHDNISIVSLT